MACPASGTITINDIVSEFGGTAPHSMSEYYRNGGEVPGNNTNVPTAMAILTQIMLLSWVVTGPQQYLNVLLYHLV